MTTIVYKAQKYIAADKRGVGGEKGWHDKQNKIFKHSGDNFNVYLLTSGCVQMPEKISQLLASYFKDSFDPTKAYDLRKELSETNYGGAFGCLLVYQDLKFNEDASTKSSTRCWKISPTCVEEADYHYAAYGSGSDYVDGIMCIDPDIDLEKLFQMVSTKDIYTSPTYDFIKLSI